MKILKDSSADLRRFVVGNGDQLRIGSAWREAESEGFAGWMASTGCRLVSEISDVIQTWQVGGACPGAVLLYRLVREPACGGQCLTADQ